MLREAGLFKKMDGFFKESSNIRFLEFTDHFDRKPKPFTVTEPKIFSIFASLAALHGVNFLSFIFEYVYGNRAKLRQLVYSALYLMHNMQQRRKSEPK